LAVTKAKKAETLDAYRDLLGRSTALIVTQYGGMNMKELDKVRRALREAGAEFHVTKNTVALIALKERGYSVPEAWMTSSTAVAFCFKDVAGVAKSLADLSKDITKLSIVGGVVDGAAVDGEGVKAIASLPPLETLRAQLIGVISAPATGIAGVLNSAVGSVMFALQAKIDKEQPAAA
jgi:large subunit ribosomal protein L10